MRSMNLRFYFVKDFILSESARARVGVGAPEGGEADSQEHGLRHGLVPGP